MEATTNLLDVAADRLSIWNTAASSHEDVRDIFLNNSNIIGATRTLQQVGDETDVILTFDQPSNAQVPALADLLSYIEQEKLGNSATVHKHYNISRHNTALINDVETIARRGRRGGEGVRGARGVAGKAQIVVNEGDLNVRTSKPPSIRGRQEMVLQQGDVHLARITRNKDVKQTTVNHLETQLLSVTKRSNSTIHNNLHFHEGTRTTIRKSVQRKTHNIIEIFAPVLLQRIKIVTKVNRAIFLFAPS
jgi:hypothetical protein